MFEQGANSAPIIKHCFMEEIVEIALSLYEQPGIGEERYGKYVFQRTDDDYGHCWFHIKEGDWIIVSLDITFIDKEGFEKWIEVSIEAFENMNFISPLDF